MFDAVYFDEIVFDGIVEYLLTVKYDWILGEPVQTDNTNYDWVLGVPYILHEHTAAPPPAAEEEMSVIIIDFLWELNRG